MRYNLDVSSDPLVGGMIGRYRVDRLLGRGGMGRVYLGIHPEIGSRVAIKVLAEDLVDSPDLVERFFSEARTVSRIHHDNIITVIDLDRLETGRPYIVMEYIAGKSLREVIEAGPPPLGEAVHAMLEVLVALAAAHAAGVVHRDLKPDNVMLASSGRAKVLDFGIAKLITDGARTRTGARLGTPEYMAPEQILGERVDPRADLYAAGVMLFELCTGARPFTGETDYQLMEGHLRGTPPSARALRPEVPTALDAVIMQALAKRPDDRFQSATAMANALRHAMAIRAPRRRKTLGIVMGLVAIGGGATIAIRPWHHADVPADAPIASIAGDAGVLDSAVVAVATLDAAPPHAPTIVANKAPPHDAGSAPDAPRTASRPRTLDSGWRRDPMWGFDPPIKTEAVIPPRRYQEFEHDLVDVTGDFDPGAWAATALKLARQLEPDARLTGFDALTNADGVLYWNRDRNVRMWFASAAAASAHDPDRLPCIYIFPNPSGVLIERTEGHCDKPGLPLPRCTLAAIYPGKVAPHDGVKSVNVSYGASGWRVDQSNGQPADSSARDIDKKTVADGCP